MELCAGCHNVWPYTWTEPNKYGKQWVMVGLVPQSYVGTDPGQFEDFRPYAITGQLAPYLPGPLKDKESRADGRALCIALMSKVSTSALAKHKYSEADYLNLHRLSRASDAAAAGERLQGGAARRRVGHAAVHAQRVGAQPLRNAAPGAERTKKFYIGREFDPVKVGLDTSGKSGKFLLDTELRGNSNAGHSFENGPRGNGVIGPLLTEEQRWALVEYLKSIPEEAGRVTPVRRTGGCDSAPLGPRSHQGDSSRVRPYRRTAIDRRSIDRYDGPVLFH